ncbi:hypothetical protein CFIMG_005862RAa [Ceratocystis fimbriata CBS 114723]|uniref:Uncharacterized protein n=1 Tax=Ceratocystis fimbriata CBS 114723 TaxID=1035309 RepID=A0A2C5WFX2_9PEZI|nr:hypothetical protein CFIMG_005862RAa [Ceratocystis fimbriata CBS 114723]
MSIFNGLALPVSGTPEFGFYVFQASLGSPLEFHPAQGTALLNEMIDIYVPGSASIGEKTGIVSIDFFKYSQTTGLSSKFYSIPSRALCNTPSLASTDSSSVSPLQPTWNCPLTPAKTATSRTPEPIVHCVSRSSKSPSASTSTAAPITTLIRARTAATDLSQIPGMKILTKDGVDVTNSASRGSKTREQRSHAHMMRIVGACESCRRKKVRCDPKHRSSTSAAAISAITRSQAASSQSRKSLARKKAAAAKAAQKEAQAPSQLSQSAQTAVSGVCEPSQPNIDEPISFLDAEINNFDDIMNWGESAIPPEILQDYEIFDKNILSPNFGSSAGSPGVAFRPPSNPIALSGSNADTAVVKTAANNRSDSLPTTQKTNTAYDSSNASLSTATEYADFCLYSPSNSFSDEDDLGGSDTLHHKSSSQNGRHSHYSQQRGIGSAQETLVPPNILTVAPTDIFHQASLSSVDSQLGSNSPTESTNASDVQVYHYMTVDDKVTESGSSSSVLVTASNSQHTLSSSKAPHTPAPELSACCNPDLCSYIGLASLFAIDCELSKDKQCNATLSPAPPASLSHPSTQPTEAATNHTSSNAQKSDGRSRTTLRYASSNTGNMGATTLTRTRAAGRKARAAVGATITPAITIRPSVQSLQLSMAVQGSLAPVTDKPVDYCLSYLPRFASFTTLGSINIKPNAWMNSHISPATEKIYMALRYSHGRDSGVVAKSSILDSDDAHKLSMVQRRKSHPIKTAYSWQACFEKETGEFLSVVSRLCWMFYIEVVWATMI